ncbi:MAG: PadR family transcriptional regulator [Oscillospiraceae bacterium]
MTPNKNLLSGSTTLLVLSLLAQGDRYGYEMIAALDAKSDHTFALKEGTLYPILHTLEKDGAVRAYDKAAPSGKQRRYYHLTKKGETLLREQKEAWISFSQTVTAIVTEGAAPAFAL